MGDTPRPSDNVPVQTVITKREDGLSTSQTGVTPIGSPDVQVIAMPWWQIVLVRTGRVYIQSLLGFLSAVGLGATGALGVEMPIGSFFTTLYTCAGLSLAPATFTLIQNIGELLIKLDVTRPTFRA